MKFTVEGLPEATAALENAIGRIAGRFPNAVDTTAEEIAVQARRNAPVDTGALRDSIGVQGSGIEVEVGALDNAYAGYVEFGTSTMNAQPFLLPAAEVNRDRFVDRVADTGKNV